MRAGRARRLQWKLFSPDGSTVMRHINADQVNAMVAEGRVVWYYRLKDGKQTLVGIRLQTSPQQSRTHYANDFSKSRGVLTRHDILLNALSQIMPTEFDERCPKCKSEDVSEEIRENTFEDDGLRCCNECEAIFNAKKQVRRSGFNVVERRDPNIVGTRVDRVRSKVEAVYEEHEETGGFVIPVTKVPSMASVPAALLAVQSCANGFSELQSQKS